MVATAVAAVLVISACGANVADTTAPAGTDPPALTTATTLQSTSPSATTTPVAGPSTTSAPTPTNRLPETTVPCISAPGCEAMLDEFDTEGSLGVFGHTGSGERYISGLALEGSGTCERFEVSFETRDGVPVATLPVTEVEILPHAGVVRISFDRSVPATAATDAVLVGRLVRRAFVVRGLDGRVFVDVHLSTAVAARALSGEEQGVLSVEFWDLGGPAPRFPEVSRFVVVTGSTTRGVEYPLVITGYSRTFEANDIAELIRPDGGREVLAVTSAADHLEMWGEFRLEIERGPSGLMTLFVGDYPPVDEAPPEGVELEFMAG